MSPLSRRSTLQLRVLEALNREPAPSVSDLARTVDSSRPSVSRSVENLQQEGLVQRIGRRICLTETGKEEASSAEARLARAAQRAAGEAARKLSALPDLHPLSLDATFLAGITSANKLALASPLSSFADLSRTLTEQTSAALLSITSMDRLTAQLPTQQIMNETMRALAMGANYREVFGASAQQAALAMGDLEKALSPSFLDAWFAQLPSLTAPLLEAQTSFASLLESVSAAHASLGVSLIAEQTKLLSSAMQDAMQISHIHQQTLASSTVLRPESLLLSARLPAMFASLDSVFDHARHQRDIDGSERMAAEQVDRLVYATRPVASYARASRYISEDSAAIRDDNSRPSRPVGNDALDPLLARLDPDYVGKRRGTWLALNGDNPDRLAHAAGSQKNLILQVLRQVVPNLPEVDDDAPGSKIKARVKQILGSDSEAEHVQNVANAVFSGYSVLNKYDHTNQKDALVLGAILQTGEALLYMILIGLDRAEE